MNRKLRFVIIGGGIAGVSAAEEIRKNSGEAEITIISKERHLPYYRINLIRYLAGEVGEDSLKIHPENWYDERNIRLITGREASRIQRKEKSIELSDGTCMGYDKLILAAGARPFVPSFKGSGLKNVTAVRTIEDVKYILERLKEVDSCICIGGGVLGLETAAAVAKRGVRVILLESAEWLMPLQLNRKAASLVKRHLQGVIPEVRENIRIREIIGEECCEGVRLEDGEVIEAKLVIVTTGIRPELPLAVDSGLLTNRGLVVDDNMRTSDGEIFAAGDMAEHRGVIYGLWNAAAGQGKIAALCALGMETRFAGLPGASVLKVSGVEVFSMGETNPMDLDCCILENEADGKYYLFVLRKGRIAGSIVVGDMPFALKVKRSIENAFEFTFEEYKDIESLIKKLSL